MSRHSEASKGANGSFKATRAAMFGLDARIALAIFGTLSVISGAALYSAIQEARLTGLAAQINEVFKAYDQFRLDTGTDLPVDSTYAHVLDIDVLLENTSPPTTGWNGPYLPTKNYNDGFFLIMRGIRDESWGDAVTATLTCTSDCDIFIGFYYGSVDFADAFDLKIDGTADRQNGRVRVTPDGSNGAKIHMKMAIHFINYFKATV